MKKIAILAAALLMISPLAFAAKKCEGADDCKACKTCAHCQWCKEPGKICGTFIATATESALQKKLDELKAKKRAPKK